MKPPCKNCHDPVDTDGAELCSWCAMTPAQRRASLRRSWLWIIFAASLLAVAIFLSPGVTPQ